LGDWAAENLEISFYSLIPSHFFYHLLFYTDPAATALVLACLAMQRRGDLEISGIFGVFAVAVRQTNIVWVFVIAAGALWDGFKGGQNFQVLWRLRLHILTGICFAAFLVWNDFSLVLGHKNLHTFSAHFAQVNYLLCTALFLGGPALWLQTLRNFQGNSRIILLLLLFACFVAFAAIGTVVHPFILADNRHFSFFIWRRFLSFLPVRIFLVPAGAAISAVYSGFGWNMPLKVSKDPEISWALIWFAICAVLIPSPLLEFRYFNLPLIFILSGTPGNSYFHWSLCIILVTIFTWFPFQSAQSGKLERFIL
jgi:alpha-1,2-glucosyltransferase